MVLPLFLGTSLLVVVALLTAAAKKPLGLVGALLGIAVSAWWGRKDWKQMYDVLQGGRAWKKGADGERFVGQLLAQLPDDYVVFNDFHFKSGEDEWHDWNVDHIVVGPTGVFVLETKNYSRTKIRAASRDAFTAKNIEEVRRCAKDLKKRLVVWSNKELEPAFVEGWLVYAQVGAFVERQWEGQTHVIPSQWLLRDLRARTKRDVDWEQAFRISLTLWNQCSPERREVFEDEWKAVVQDHKTRREQHLTLIRAAKAAATDLTSTAIPTTCPSCGAPLVRRVPKSGPWAGKAFLGCSSWHSTRCSYKFNLDEPAA